LTTGAEPTLRTIYKYPFPVTDEINIEMPRDAQILSVQFQGHTACMWAMVVPERKMVMRHFRIFGTGHPIEMEPQNDLVHVATFQQPPFVWHLFEVVPPAPPPATPIAPAFDPYRIGSVSGTAQADPKAVIRI
jgi:hypothetical protein